MNRLLILMTLLFALMGSSVQAQNTQQNLLSRINGLRAQLGLSPYRLNSALTGAANSHAQWMATTSQVSHIQENGSSPRSRAQANGYNSQWVSENIYMGGLASVDTAWNFWVNSAIHYAGLTSPNYQDVGIGTARGNGGQAYVLVFGVPSGASVTNNARGASSASDGNTVASAPLAIVGYDAVGNIEYELQAGDTLGDVLLLFGYTWDDLNNLLALNDFTDDDIRNLAVGQVVLVPPPQGTYTPTPDVEITEEPLLPTATPDALQSVTQAIVDGQPTASSTVDNTGILPTPLPENIQPTSIPTLTPQIIGESLGQPATFVATTPTATLTLSPTPIPTLSINSPSLATEQATGIAQVATPMPTTISQEATPANRSSPPLWLVIAIIIQVGVLVIASIVTIRRMIGK